MSNTLELYFQFKAMTERKLKEEPLQSWGDVLAGFGGVLGLMTGFSLMSAVELFIYATLLAYERCSRQL